ncbi:MAG: carotenoid 1,2-hydratase [Pseudomonadales bacterium]|nr:carotenoid 1,2-hydratase [Pseudomonadales bacterium]NIX08981.1 carotenoid 1,2-hydratase [Pseudomonadales bacterium]
MRIFSLLAVLLSLLLLGPGCQRDDRADGGMGEGSLRLSSVLGGTDLQGFARAETVVPIRFPRDHGPHPGFRSEWWYLTANVQNEFGAEFGLQFTVFRQALAPTVGNASPWLSNQVYLAHAAVTGVVEQRHWHEERIARGHPGIAGATAKPFRVWVDGWELAGRSGGFDEQRLTVNADAFAVDLQLDALKGPVLQGDRGLSAKGPEQASYYYSLPRLRAWGTLRIGEVEHQVSGRAWIDREWSTSVLSGGQVGWDWFALHLDDSWEIMAYQLRRADGTRDRYDHAVLFDPSGTKFPLAAEDFELEPEIFWEDEDGVSWPLQWRLHTPDRELRIRAAVPDQRMQTSVSYWEGLVGVFDMAGRRVGRGYMELTGYGE